MIRRRRFFDTVKPAEAVTPRGFDTFELKLGELMRGERATMGKSLMDVQRELKIKANYIAAIENSDPSAFDTPGFIAGYVRSYARYLGMDPDRAFELFCTESGFTVAHGMAPEASVKAGAKSGETKAVTSKGAPGPFDGSKTPYLPQSEALLSRVEPGAIGSGLVLLALIGLIGFGGWTVLQEVQRVQIAPVDQTPTVVSDIDPLAPAAAPELSGADVALATEQNFTPEPEALDRLYRQQALDVPVLVARDAPIASLDPAQIGAFAEAPQAAGDSAIDAAVTEALELVANETPQSAPVAEGDVKLIAVRPAWVRIRAEDGAVIFEKILDAGEEYVVAKGEGVPNLRAGNSGALYLKVGEQVYGPVGPGTSTARNVALSPEAVTANYQIASAADEPALGAFMVASVLPQVVEAPKDGVAVLAVREAWIQVRAADGSVLFSQTLAAGEEYQLPATEGAPLLRTGNAGAVFMRVGSDIYGPVGSGPSIASNVNLSADNVAAAYAKADPTSEPGLDAFTGNVAAAE